MRASKGPIVTVVTPVFNGEAYLAECIESVLGQTYDRWEYVIVNNQSTDRSLEIALQYAQKDPRIRVMTNEHFVDVMRSQNIAFRQVSPESTYCKMVHADDWLFPDCLRLMVELAEGHPSVGIAGAYRLDDTVVTPSGLPYPCTSMPGRELCRAILLGGPGVFGSNSSILFRSEYIRSRERFLDETDFHGDTGVCYEILQNCDFGFVHQVLTYTRRHPEAQTKFAESMNTYLAGQLRHLQRYGPIYLSREDYDGRLRWLLAEYYRFLGRSLLEPGGDEIWRFHEAALASLGHRVSAGRLLVTLLAYWQRAVTSPILAGRLAGRFLWRLISPGADVPPKGVR
jgi:glycosyltransferase involved in cell wall biosynthesis